MRQGATIRVAQHESLGTVRFSHSGHRFGEDRVVEMPVEEVLQIDEHSLAVGYEEVHRISDHLQGFVVGRAKRLFDVAIPCLGHDADDRRVGLDEGPKSLVIFCGDAGSAGGTERDERRGRQGELTVRSSEELRVLRIRPRPTAFDEGDAQVVELLSHADLVLNRQRDALLLGAVSQGGVEDLDEVREYGQVESMGVVPMQVTTVGVE